MKNGKKDIMSCGTQSNRNFKSSILLEAPKG